MSEPDGDEMYDDAHAGASPVGGARPGIRENVRVLTGHLGPTLEAVPANGQDSGMVSRWAREDGPAPDQSAESRLRLAYRVWTVLLAVESSGVARMWFLGANPWLRAISPVEAITQMHTNEVLGAAQAMIEDRHAD